MKIVRILFRIVGAVLLVLLLLVVVVRLADHQQTNYLKVKNYSEFRSDTWLITHVNVLPMNRDTILENHSVLIEDGRISAISDTIAAPNVPVIDGNNGYLLPGLTDMHVHVWDQYELGLYLSKGVTAVRNLWGRPFHLKLKEQISTDEIIGPLFFTSGPKLTGPDFMGDDNTQLFSVAEARAKVKEIDEEGYDLIKIYYGLPEDYFNAILDEAEKRDLDIASHTSNKVDYASYFRPEIVSIEHAEDIVQQALNYTLDTVKLKEVVSEFSMAEGTSFCPTLIVYYNIYTMLTNDEILQSPAADQMNPLIRMFDSKAQFDRWATTRLNDPDITEKVKQQHEFHLKAVKSLHEAGVNIICGSDAGIGVTPAGYSIHQELEFYRQAGLSPFEALETATVNPSRVHDFLEDTGTVEPGKIANLLLVANDPLEDPGTLEAPDLVFVKGHKLDRTSLDDFEDRAANRNNLLASLIRYAGYLWQK